MKKVVLFTLAVCFYAQSSFAQVSFSENRERFGYSKGKLSSFTRSNNNQNWKRAGDKKVQLRPSPEIVDRVNADAIDLILSPKMVKCYNIKNKSPLAEVLTIQGYEAVGSCGELKEDALYGFQQNVFSIRENIDVETAKKCNIKPSVLLRFEKALDSVDVLVSSNPSCNYVTVKYAGQTDHFNVTPMISWIKEFIKTAKNNKEKINVLAPKKADYTGKENLGEQEKQATGLENWNKKESATHTGGWIKKSYGFSVKKQSEKEKAKNTKTKAPVTKNNSPTGTKIKRNW